VSDLVVSEKLVAAAAPTRAAARPLWRSLLPVLPFLVLASYKLFDDRLLGYHHYRQAHDALMARTFATTTLNPLLPAIDGITWGKALYLNDFPLYPWLVGLAWRVTGESLVVARLLALAFGLLALWAFRRLTLRWSGDRRLADLATLLLGAMPVCAWFFRTVQRQSLFVLLLLVALERAVCWMDEDRRGALRAAAAALAGAVLLNPFAVYAALPLADRLVRRRGWRALWSRPVLVFGALALLPAALWYGRVARVAPTLATAGLVGLTAPVAHRDFLDPGRDLFWLSPDALLTVRWTTIQFVLPFVTSLLVFLLGMWVTRREEAFRFPRLWVAAVLLYFLFDYYPIAHMVHQYYYVNLAPPAAVFAAAGFLALHRAATAPGAGTGRRVLRNGVAALFLLGAAVYTERMAGNRWHEEYYPIAERLSRTVPRGARVDVLATSDDPLFSFVLDGRFSHRLHATTPALLERVLADREFDYVAVVYELDVPAPWPTLHRLRAEGLEEILVSEGLIVYRRAA
jgi:hypothetical protein